MQLRPLGIPDRISRHCYLISDGDIQFDDVNFSYDEKTPVLRNIRFSIPHGKRIALVGESGSGKTTITSLLCQFYQNYSGRIAIGSTDLSTVPLEKIRKKIGLITQNCWIFQGTVYNNIVYGKTYTKPSLKEVKELCSEIRIV